MVLVLSIYRVRGQREAKQKHLTVRDADSLTG